MDTQPTGSDRTDSGGTGTASRSAAKRAQPVVGDLRTEEICNDGMLRCLLMGCPSVGLSPHAAAGPLRDFEVPVRSDEGSALRMANA